MTAPTAESCLIVVISAKDYTHRTHYTMPQEVYEIVKGAMDRVPFRRPHITVASIVKMLELAAPELHQQIVVSRVPIAAPPPLKPDYIWADAP